MQLQVGKTYQSHRPAETIDLDGEIIQFQGETFTFTVLPKPDEVTAVTVDIHGEERERVKLPRHLQKPEWYWIRKENGVTCWFNQNLRQITEVTTTEE
ncbi:hypothetical protein O1C94_000401 [Vibrio cholerae]|nr:hypothetical protein [Vibrio cholerae]